MNLERAWDLHGQAVPKGAGKVYTPRDIALQLAQLVLSPLESPPTLLDPACGSGALLLGAIEWARTERPSWIDFWREDGLSGWDTDADAVASCNRVVATALGDHGRQFALQRNGLEATGQYDCVVANPPWVSYSGRHSRDIQPELRARLAVRFPAFAGWPALHAAFAEQCAGLTRQDNGRLGLLLPLQMADLAGYGAARRALARHFRLEHSLDLGERAFAGVTEPAGMFVFGAGVAMESRWLPNESSALLEQVRRFSPLPADSFGDVGVHTGNAAKLLVGRGGAGQPLRVGRDIAAFSLSAPSHVLREVELPEGRYARVASETRYRDAVIVLRQTASRPIAARHEPWAYFRNSVLACYGAPGHDPDYLLGVLNSELMARIHKSMHRDARQRSFPQLKISHLRSLPVPGRECGPVYGQIANAARAVQAGDPQARAEINSLVEQAYGV